MTPEKSTFASIRFGFGIAVDAPPPAGAQALLDHVLGPDSIVGKYPVRKFERQMREEVAVNRLRKAVKSGDVGAEQKFKLAQQASRDVYQRDVLTNVIRPLVSKDGFRERLVRFWADHFTIIAKGRVLRNTATSYVEEAIRPYITGSFSDLLRSAATHPVMLIFLDQVLSVGPNSRAGLKRGKGLNENLAREILELHTLGVGGAYTQTDVREFAELLTGLHFNRKNGFKFQPHRAEPGAETVLGKSYGSDTRAKIGDIYQALDDIAHHPDTARHISRKLAVHFVSDDPDQGLIDHITRAFSASGGNLPVAYAAMLEHPAAWQNFGRKAKQPFDYIVSGLRAMGVGADKLMSLNRREYRLYLTAPMQVMGQTYQHPGGPDGWPEDMDNWITPQGMAARIQWALLTTQALAQVRDPQEFARFALRDAVGNGLLRAVGAAESRLEGMALVLASPQFNRR